ncbi:Low-density lipoprotein receptor- protein 1B [Saguinus oedipus]|uniref:Low-density lipoprotein receptor- protein 1B n=1 Tax=Saguinus oedipus TaxID=9490 RepID=A0ABQ9VHY7_SAGOE|nr:Low-density lipoprotein receptor- protein 1B [Saguinus oedipus]
MTMLPSALELGLCAEGHNKQFSKTENWDANFPRIESASMSGAGRKTIYKDMKTGAWPNGLTVDHFEKRIVWTDARSDAIYSALYDGTNMIEIIRGHEYLSHPFAVSLYGSEVYWTDWRTNTLSKANKWTGQNVSVIQKTSAQPFDLQIYHPSRQPQGRHNPIIEVTQRNGKDRALKNSSTKKKGKEGCSERGDHEILGPKERVMVEQSFKL